MAPSDVLSTSRRLLACQVPEAVLAMLQPLFQRASLFVEHLERPRAALELLHQVPFSGLVVGYPLEGMKLGPFLESVFEAGSASRKIHVLVAIDAPERRADLSPYLDEGIDGIVSPDEDPLFLQHTVSDLLGVAPRRAMRSMVRLQATLAGRSLFCHSLDVSATGALLETSEPLEVGAQLEFHFFLPGLPNPLAGRLEVVRQTQPDVSGVQGVGVRFLSFEDDGARQIKRILMELD